MGTTVKKHEIDMLHGSIWNKLPLFALPVAATAILEQLFHASDVAIVGNFTGDARTVAVAAVGANGPIIGLIVNLFIGIALGANVVIANAIGCRDDNAVKRSVHTAIVFAVCGGAAVALLGQLIASPLLSILNVPEDVFPYALLYLRIYLLGMPVILLYNFEAAILLYNSKSMRSTCCTAHRSAGRSQHLGAGGRCHLFTGVPRRGGGRKRRSSASSTFSSASRSARTSSSRTLSAAATTMPSSARCTRPLCLPCAAARRSRCLVSSSPRRF